MRDMTLRTTVNPKDHPRFSSGQIQRIMGAMLVLLAIAAPAASDAKWCRVNTSDTSKAVRNSSAKAAVNPCIRYAPGSVVQDPEDLFSVNGTLTVNLFYNTGIDANGLDAVLLHYRRRHRITDIAPQSRRYTEC